MSDGRQLPVHVSFDDVPWVDEGPGIRSRAATVPGFDWAVVEYAPAARRAEWCTLEHHGYVLGGAVTYELGDGRSVSARAGDGFWLPPGVPHRAFNGDATTTIFFVNPAL